MSVKGELRYKVGFNDSSYEKTVRLSEVFKLESALVIALEMLFCHVIVLPAGVEQ